MTPRTILFALLFALAASPLFAQVEDTPWIIVGGNNQIIEPGVPFELQARLTGDGPVGGVELGLQRIITGGPSVECESGVTDAEGFVGIVCITGFWTLETNVRITLEDELGRPAPDFTVTLRPVVIAEGLRNLGPDRITIARGQSYDFLVQAARFGQPLEGLRLTVERTPTDVPLSCPVEVFTDFLGQAVVTCRSLETLQVNSVVLVTVSDGMGNAVTLTVNMLAADRLVDGIYKLSGDDIAVAQGTPFPIPLVTQVIIDGFPQSGVDLQITVSDPNLIFCPTEVETDRDGLAYIQCSANFIQNNGFAVVYVQDRDERFLAQPFRVSVVDIDLNVTAIFDLESNHQLFPFAGNTVNNAVVVTTRNPDGTPLGGVPVFFSSNQNILFNPAVMISGHDGRAATNATFGCPGGRGYINVGSRPGAAQIRVPVDVRTGGPAQLLRRQGDGLTGRPGERITHTALVAQLTDRCLNPVSRQQVSWRVLPPDAATLENVVSTTDGNGRSSVIVRNGMRPGPFQVIAKYAEHEAIFNVAVIAEPGRVSAIGSERITQPRNAATDIGVRVLSEEGFSTPGQTVFFSILSGGGELSKEAVITNAQGEAVTEFTSPASFGTTRIVAELAQSPAQGAFSVEFEVVTGGRRPVINSDGFVNGGSFRPGWTPGSLGTIFGQGVMEDVTRLVTPPGPPFPTQTRGLSVTINGHAAPLITLADQGTLEQVNLQIPFEVEPGPATVVVSNNGTEQTFEGVQINRAQPGIFEVDLAQGRYAAALHADFRLVQPADPALPGEVILLFLTGLGPTSPAALTNTAGPAPAPMTVFEPTVGLDHQGVESFGAFYAPGLATVYQINFRVPADIEPGDKELTVVTDGMGSQTTLLPIGGE